MANSVIPKSLASDVNTLNSEVAPLLESVIRNGYQTSGVSSFDDMPLNRIVWVNGTYEQAPLDSATNRFAGYVFTLKPLKTHGFQIAIHYDGTNIYIRTCADNVWRRWYRISTTTT